MPNERDQNSDQPQHAAAGPATQSSDPSESVAHAGVPADQDPAVGEQAHAAQEAHAGYDATAGEQAALDAPDAPDAQSAPDARDADAARETRDAHEPGAGDPFAHDGDEHDAGGEPDYYAVLGVRPNASAAEIRHAYHRLAKLWHPDRFTDAPPRLRTRAERRMRALVAANQVLGDNERRQTYDGRLRPGGHAAWVDISNTPPIWMGGTARVPYGPPEISPFTPVAKPGSPNGAGIFLGALAAVVALSVLIGSLNSNGGPGTFIGYAFAALLGGLAIWCLVAAEAAPVRVVRHWMESDPGVRAAEQADSDGVPLDDTTGVDDTSDASDDGHGGAEDEAMAGFERLVDEALASIPTEFQREMPNVVVRIKDTPSADELARLEVGKHGLLLGLYEGVELTRQGAAGVGPEVITIFREPIERYCHGDPERIRKQVRRTVLHEVAHHFGIDHEQMPDWIR